MAETGHRGWSVRLTWLRKFAASHCHLFSLNMVLTRQFQPMMIIYTPICELANLSVSYVSALCAHPNKEIKDN